MGAFVKYTYLSFLFVFYFFASFSNASTLPVDVVVGKEWTTTIERDGTTIEVTQYFPTAHQIEITATCKFKNGEEATAKLSSYVRVTNSTITNTARMQNTIKTNSGNWCKAINDVRRLEYKVLSDEQIQISGDPFIPDGTVLTGKWKGILPVQCLDIEVFRRVNQSFDLFYRNYHQQGAGRKMTESDFEEWKCFSNSSIFHAFNALDTLLTTTFDYRKIKPSRDGLFKGSLFTEAHSPKQYVRSKIRTIVFSDWADSSFFSKKYSYQHDSVFQARDGGSLDLDQSSVPVNSSMLFVDYASLTHLDDVPGQAEIMKYLLVSDLVWLLRVTELPIRNYSKKNDTFCYPTPEELATPPSSLNLPTYGECESLSEKGAVYYRVEYLGTVLKGTPISNEARKFLVDGILRNFFLLETSNPLGFTAEPLFNVVDTSGVVYQIDERGTILKKANVDPNLMPVDRYDGSFSLFSKKTGSLSIEKPFPLMHPALIQVFFGGVDRGNPDPDFSSMSFGGNEIIGLIHSMAPPQRNVSFSKMTTDEDWEYNRKRYTYAVPASGVVHRDSRGFVYFSSFHWGHSRPMVLYPPTPVNEILNPRVCDGKFDELFLADKNKVYKFVYPINSRVWPNCKNLENLQTECFYDKEFMNYFEDVTKKCDRSARQISKGKSFHFGISAGNILVRRPASGGAWSEVPNFAGKSVRMVSQPYPVTRNYKDPEKYIFDLR